MTRPSRDLHRIVEGRAGACRVHRASLVHRQTLKGGAMEKSVRGWESVDFFDVDNVERPDEPIAPGAHCLVYGPKESGKTTLLFQHALSVANRDPSARVMFVCKRDAIEARPPLLQRASTLGDGAGRIQLKYLNNDAELRRLGSVIHLLPPETLPTLIVIDGMTSFFAPAQGGDNREREMRLARTLASLHECADSCGRMRSEHVVEGEQCLLLASCPADGNHDAPPVQWLWYKWFPCVFGVRQVHDQDPGGGQQVPGGAQGQQVLRQFEVKPRRWAVGCISNDPMDDKTGITYSVDRVGGSLVPTGLT